MIGPQMFITGASSGIGQALARCYHDAGYRLALVARRTRALQVWVDEQGFSTGSYQIDHADVSIVNAGQACIAAQGVPALVVANAGISIGMYTAERDDLAVMAHVLATNTVGAAATFHPFVAGVISGKAEPERAGSHQFRSCSRPQYGACNAKRLQNRSLEAFYYNRD